MEVYLKIYSESDYYECDSNTQCGVCEYCQDGRFCAIVNDGTSCGDNLICTSGKCVKNTTCSDNSECNKGHYCGDPKSTGATYPSEKKSCIKAEVKVITSNIGNKFYLSHQKLRTQEDAIALCASINKTLISDYTNNPDIVQRISELTAGDTHFYGQNEHLYAYPTYKIPNSDMRIITSISGSAYAVCVD